MDENEAITEGAAPKHDGIPHVNVVVAVTFFVLVGFGAVSIYILGRTSDDVITGALIGTWTSLATAAGGFWLGASSGGKLKK